MHTSQKIKSLSKVLLRGVKKRSLVRIQKKSAILVSSSLTPTHHATTRHNNIPITLWLWRHHCTITNYNPSTVANLPNSNSSATFQRLIVESPTSYWLTLNRESELTVTSCISTLEHNRSLASVLLSKEKQIWYIGELILKKTLVHTLDECRSNTQWNFHHRDYQK